eukprot:3938803-Pyramimonas_sp.AAC.1
MAMAASPLAAGHAHTRTAAARRTTSAPSLASIASGPEARLQGLSLQGHGQEVTLFRSTSKQRQQVVCHFKLAPSISTKTIRLTSSSSSLTWLRSTTTLATPAFTRQPSNAFRL